MWTISACTTMGLAGCSKDGSTDPPGARTNASPWKTAIDGTDDAGSTSGASRPPPLPRPAPVNQHEAAPVKQHPGPKLGKTASVVIEEGKAVTLSIRGGRLHIPAGALEAGTSISFSASSVASSDYPADRFPDEVAVSSVFTVASSNVQPALTPLQIQLDLPETLVDAFVGRVKIEGGLASGAHTEPDWWINAGDFDSDSHTLAFSVGGTAKRLSYVVVAARSAD